MTPGVDVVDSPSARVLSWGQKRSGGRGRRIYAPSKGHMESASAELRAALSVEVPAQNRPLKRLGFVTLGVFDLADPAAGHEETTSKPLASLLADLDVTRSHNRPRTSNDNPFSESQSKTMKYVPDYPERFASIGEARAWMEAFIACYNHEHRHSGIGLYTPASVHYGTAWEVQRQRQHVLDAAYTAHPERFRRRPQAPQLPTRVTINDPLKRQQSSPLQNT